MTTPNRVHRDSYLKQLMQTLVDLHGKSNSAETARALQSRYETLLTEYVRSLPRVPIARCPFTQKIVEFPFDHFGLDGLWWDVNGPTAMVAIPGTHHVVTLGAFDTQGHTLAEANTPIIESFELGPEIPYITPSLMQETNMRCVIHSIPVCEGKFTATLMSYFCDTPIDDSTAHQPWLRRQIATNSGGHITWKRADDAWDFDLVPWIEETPTRVFWIESSDASMTLRTGVDGCPFIDLKGSKDLQLIRNGILITIPSKKDTP